MGDEIAVKVEHVSKNFILPRDKITSLKSAFTGMFHRDTNSELQTALRDISFKVKKGEFFGIVGRNGSGKSTLLKILAGIYQPTGGRVHTIGKLVPFIELGVGFNPELSGRENVFLNGAMLGFSRKEVSAMYDGIVAFAELERFMDQKLKNYSSGMQVRLAFSVATRAEADILLVDEVLAVGDADFQRKCFDYFRKLKKQKKTVIFVTHDMNAVREYCDRAALLENSDLVVQGSSDKVASAYSRMFIEEVGEDEPTSESSKRWGNKDIVFDSFSLRNKRLTEKNTSLVIDADIHANVDSEEIVAGFSIKGPKGDLILGTNSQIIKQRVAPLKKDEPMRLTWSIPNIFSEGKYDVTLALVHKSVESDWIEDALSFNSYPEQRTPYLVNPKIELGQSRNRVEK